MLTSDFDYHLPPESIAQVPCAERDASRMLIVDRSSRAWRDASFRDLPGQLRAGDLLVINETRVIPARLHGLREETGGKVEVLLVEPDGTGADRWLCWTRSGGRLREGEFVKLADGSVRGCIVERRGESGDVLEFSPPGAIDAAIEKHGETPLPPYIRREGAGAERDELARLDRERYQTVYAREPGAVAAPTAGLHFTRATLDALRGTGVMVESLVLHVGPGTFRPVKAERVEDHRMHPERYSIPAATAEAVRSVKASGGRVVAVGTTVARALEASAAENPGGEVTAGESSTEIFIRPPYEFRAVDAMLTNFHLPRSTLIMLVSALAGTETILAAYRHAVEAGYRFYSYGDAMLII